MLLAASAWLVATARHAAPGGMFGVVGDYTNSGHGRGRQPKEGVGGGVP